MNGLGRPQGLLIGVAAVVLLSFLGPRPVAAIPLFAHQYDVTCAKCHSVIPHLNEFGAAFMASGYRIPGVQPGPAVPLSAKPNLVDSSENQGPGPDGAGLPKAIVDEVEVFTAGAIGTRSSFLVEQYAGRRRLARPAARRLGDRPPQPVGRPHPVLRAGRARSRCRCRSIPRRSATPTKSYAPYAQSVGANPFTFFDPKIGARVSARRPAARRERAVLRRSRSRSAKRASRPPAPTRWWCVQDAIGPLTLTTFGYQGTRDGDARHARSLPAHRLWPGLGSVGPLLERERA